MRWGRVVPLAPLRRDCVEENAEANLPGVKSVALAVPLFQGRFLPGMSGSF